MEKGNLSSFPAFDTKKHSESNKQDNEIKTSVLNFKVTVKSIWVENNEAASEILCFKGTADIDKSLDLEKFSKRNDSDFSLSLVRS